MTRYVKIKDPLPEDSRKIPNHLAHSLKGQRGTVVGEIVHPVYKVNVYRVEIAGKSILIFPEWTEPLLPRGGFF